MLTARGFTLVELLVTISIIAILSSVGTVIYTNATNTARTGKLNADFEIMRDRIARTRVIRDDVLGNLTRNWYSAGGSCLTGDVRNPPCITINNTSWSNLTNGAEPTIPLDPWGNPYLLDENELEPTFPPCRRDSIKSVGSDHVTGGTDDVIYYFYMYKC